MFRRVVEQFFRHKILILAPVLLIPLAATVLTLQTPPYYQAQASVWVERPTFVAYRDELERYAAPADTQSKRLRELLLTRTFSNEIIQKAPATSAVPSPDDAAALAAAVAAIEVTPGGRNLLIVTARASTAAAAHGSISGLIAAFKDRQVRDAISQAALAKDFYAARVQEAEINLDKSTAELRAYREAHPAATPRPGAAPAPPDLELAQLQRQFDIHQLDAERLRATLEQTRREGVAAQSGQEVGFQVLDQPQLPQSARRELRRMAVLPGLGIVVGLFVGAILLTLLTATDRSVRFPADLAGRIPVLGSVPRFGGKPDADMRKAIGEPIGAPARMATAR